MDIESHIAHTPMPSAKGSNVDLPLKGMPDWNHYRHQQPIALSENVDNLPSMLTLFLGGVSSHFLSSTDILTGERHRQHVLLSVTP